MNFYLYQRERESEKKRGVLGGRDLNYQNRMPFLLASTLERLVQLRLTMTLSVYAYYPAVG